MSDLSRVAVLAEPLRRQVFDEVRRAAGPVSREDIASSLGISRKLAAFHLEKLLEHELLVSHYARPAGRSGPGAGRSAKFYAPAEVEVDVSIPDRRYALAGELLLEAVLTEKPKERAGTAAVRVAGRKGREIGAEAAGERGRRPPSAERTLAMAGEILDQLGFETYRPDRSAVALRNCPFHALAQQAPELMCEMNRAFLEGIVRGLGNETVSATLTCAPGDCCVTLRAPRGRDR